MRFHYSASVIIPTFNRKTIVLEVLKQLSKQEGHGARSFEVIVVDDGSTDGTRECIQEHIRSGSFPFTLVYTNTGLSDVFGTARARNMGIEAARGEFLLFLDDDCLPHKRWVHTHSTMLKAGERVVVGYISNNRPQLNVHLPIAIDNPVMQRLYTESQKDELSELLSGNFAVHRDCIKRCGMFDTRFVRKDVYGYEDIEFGHRLRIGGFDVRFNKNALVYTKIKPQATNQKREEMKQKAKILWMYIVTHPLDNLPITPLLKLYAAQKKREFIEHGINVDVLPQVYKSIT